MMKNLVNKIAQAQSPSKLVKIDGNENEKILCETFSSISLIVKIYNGKISSYIKETRMKNF